MGFLDFFRRKKPEQVQEVSPEQLEKEQALASGKRYVEHKCSICNELIGTGKYVKVQQNFMHKKCVKRKKAEMGL